jgi:hypothetical protein
MVGVGFGVEIESAFGIKNEGGLMLYRSAFHVPLVVSSEIVMGEERETLQAKEACQRIFIRGIHPFNYIQLKVTDSTVYLDRERATIWYQMQMKRSNVPEGIKYSPTSIETR